MKLCRLQYVAGRVEDCPEEGCPFWEPGRPLVGGGCAFEKLDVGDHPALAAWLLRIRNRLEAEHAGKPNDQGRRLFYRLKSDN